MRTTIKAGLAAVAAVALVTLGAPLMASAHTPNASLTCSTASVNLTAYDRAATATVVLDGTTLHSGTFGGQLVTNYPTGGGNTEHHLIVQVKSFDQLNGQGVSPYDYAFDQTTSGCYTAPPLTEVTGLVAFADGSCVDSVRVGNTAEVTAVSGVRYSYSLNGDGPNPLPAQSYDESIIVPGSYVVTAESSDPAHYVYVATSSWSHTFAAVPTECAPVVTPPTDPPLVPPVVTPPTDPPLVPPVVTPPTDPPLVPPVVTPPTDLLTPPAIPAASADKLAYTGADSSMLVLAGAVGLMLLSAGVVAIVAVKLRERTPRYRRTPSE